MFNTAFQTMVCASTAALPALYWIHRFGYSRQAAGIAMMLALIGGALGLSATMNGLSIRSSIRRSLKGALYAIGIKNFPFLMEYWNVSRGEPKLDEIRPANPKRLKAEEFDENRFWPVVKLGFFLGISIAALGGYYLAEGEFLVKRLLFSLICAVGGGVLFGFYACVIRLLMIPGPHRWEMLGALAFGIALSGLMTFAIGPSPPGGPSDRATFALLILVFGTPALGVAILCAFDKGDTDTEE